MKRIFALVVALGMVIGWTVSAHAVLSDRGGGLIYDTDLNVTWLQDANYAQTSRFDADGLMTWADATAWADNLSYFDTVRGVTYTDWRLPTTLQPDPSCSFQSGGISLGLNCTGSEMGHLYYTGLGNAAGGPLTHTSPFTNVQPEHYWSGTEYVLFPTDAWAFFFFNGFQFTNNEDFNYFYAFAVRPGDVAAVPEPASLLLLGFGLVGLAMMRRRFRG